jgi:hypothetical protein
MIVVGIACHILRELAGKNYINGTTNYEYFFSLFLLPIY